MAWSGNPDDANSPANDDLDLDDCYCPSCGMQARPEDVFKWPRAKGWWNRTGKVKCHFCGATFQVVMVQDEDDTPRLP